jgi:tetratricopeptide (TPR) repeat protein
VLCFYVILAQHPRRPLACFVNSHGIISFTDPHPLTLLESYRFKNIGGRGGWIASPPLYDRLSLSTLESTLRAALVSVADKGLIAPLSLLDATLAKNGGVGCTLISYLPVYFILFTLMFCPVLFAETPIETLKPAPQAVSQSPGITGVSKEQESLLAEARALLEKGSINEADRLVRQYLQTHPDSADGHFLLGHILFREIQSEARVETQFEGVQVLGAGAPPAKRNEEKARASLAEFTAAAKFRDPSAADLKVVAFDYVLLGDYMDADKWLTKMLQWTPNDADGWYLLGRTKYNENRFSEGVDAFQHCLKLDPRNVKAEDNLGLSYAGLGRREEAAAAYQQAIAWQSGAPLKNPGPYIDFGDLLLDENRIEEAVSYLLQAIGVAPRESRAHELLGKAYTHLEELPKAQSELEKAIELSPHKANLHCMLAPIYRKQGLADKAKIEFDRCANLAGSHSVPPTSRP